MENARIHSSDVAFSPSVKAAQTRLGSRRMFERHEAAGGWQTRLTPDLAALITAQTSIFFATASAAGQPYIQHRGGPHGFLHVIDDRTIGFADFAGNKQYITLGNLSENPKAHIFLMDYAHRQRVKIWGEAHVVEDNPELITELMPADYRARPERAILFVVSAWDVNCPQHIPQMFEAEAVRAALEARDNRIAELEAEIARLHDAAKGA